MRKMWVFPAAVFLLSGAAPAAETDADNTNAVMTACSAPELPAASVDSCLERVRILEETDTSPGLASLEARLEARVAVDREPVGPASAGGAAVDVRRYNSYPAPPDRDVGPADTANATRAATGDPRSLQTDDPAAAVDDSAAPEDRASPGAAAAADNPPPDDEPPIADPPDSDAAPGAGDGGGQPGDPGQ